MFENDSTKARETLLLNFDSKYTPPSLNEDAMKSVYPDYIKETINISGFKADKITYSKSYSSGSNTTRDIIIIIPGKGADGGYFGIEARCQASSDTQQGNCVTSKAIDEVVNKFIIPSFRFGSR